jgi:hypothetical protein
MTTDRNMIAAWEKAADDLGIEVGSRHFMGDEQFPVHVPLFGRPAGALPLWIGDQRSRRQADAKGYYISWLNPEVYCKYDRGQFIETLVDCGWFGAPDEAPMWYKDEVAKVKG